MSYCRPRKCAFIAAVACSLAVAGRALGVNLAVSRDFNGPETAWKLLDTGIAAQVLAHDCRAGGARDNNGFERIVVAASAGQSAVLVCPIPRVAALDELQVRMWVNASRPDIQVAVRVTLPRSLDPQRRSAATAIVRGSTVSRPGHWQELVVADVPKLLAAQIRVMRAIPGASIDPREAFVDAVVLIVPGEPNGVEVGTDQLEVDGVVLPTVGNVATAGKGDNPPAAARAAAVGTKTGGRPGDANVQNDAVRSADTSPVRLQGMTLIVDDKPFLPRAIPWNGESLQFLSQRGFNVLQLPAPPNAQQIADAERYDLWFMCRPPQPDALTRDGLGQPGDRVLAWCLEDEAVEVDPNYALRWAELVRERDAIFGRPVIVAPNSNWDGVSKAADILIARHPRTGVVSAAEYEHWLADRPRLARPGTPVWAGIGTQVGDAVRRQTAALTGAAAPPANVDVRQLESLVEVACTGGARGFVFQSSSSLSETDASTRQRAAGIELVNRRLQLMEPWLAGGKVIGRLAAANGNHAAVVLYVDRARLLVPVEEQTDGGAPTNNAAASNSTSAEIAFLVPGVSESSQAFVISPAAMRSLSTQRVAGGTRITVPATSAGLVLVTEDPLVIQSLRQRIARDSNQSVRLERDLAAQRAQALFDTDRRLVQLGYRPNLGTGEAASINGRLAQLDSLLTTGQFELAQDVAVAVSKDVDRAADAQRRAVNGSVGIDSNPLAASPDRLAEYAAFRKSLDTMHRGENLLVGGDFEDLGQMTQLGWQHVSRPAPGIETSAQLSAAEPRHGTYCLELNAAAGSPNKTDDGAGNLVWIVSPPVSVGQNQLVEITGWVRIDKPFADGTGLEVVDTLGGPELALDIGQTSGWQPFRMIRAAAESTELRLTFALSGIGAAKVDAVMVQTLEQPVARRLPAVAPKDRLPPTSTANGPVRLPATRQAR